MTVEQEDRMLQRPPSAHGDPQAAAPLLGDDSLAVDHLGAELQREPWGQSLVSERPTADPLARLEDPESDSESCQL